MAQGSRYSRSESVRDRQQARESMQQHGWSDSCGQAQLHCTFACPRCLTPASHPNGAVLQVEFGDIIKLVGDAPELGEWDVDRAPELSWSDGDFWKADVELPPSSEVRFKVRLRDAAAAVATTRQSWRIR